MALYATTALTGLGYLSSQGYEVPEQSVDPLKTDITNRPLDSNPPRNTGAMPSSRSAYDSDYYKDSRNDEVQRTSLLWNASQTPLQTGVVPRPAYADMFSDIEHPEQPQPKGYFKSLSGETLATGEFSHNNMQPFMKGRVKQSLDPFVNEAKLEAFTGRGGVLQHKRESEAFFKPQRGVTNICGMKSTTDFYQERIIEPKARNNDQAIEQVRVGRGLGQGFTSEGSGGFQQANTLDYIRPKSIDELRVLSRPKVVYAGRTKAPAASVNKSRGNLPNVNKNKMDTFYEQTEDQWLKTTGAFMKEKSRPVQIIKPTSRPDSHVDYSGAAVKTTNNNGDYGKANILITENERDITTVRTVQNNLTSLVKAIVAPFVDIMRHNRSEYFVDSARTFGSMHVQIPSKPTVYDPVGHCARTTIKETLIHDAEVGNLKGPEKQIYAQEEDPEQMRTTNRETLDFEETTVNLASHTYITTFYNADDVMRKTVRETTEDAAREEGILTGPQDGGYLVTPIQMYTTVKQLTSDNDHYGPGGSEGDFRERDREAEFAMRFDAGKELLEEGRVPTPKGDVNGLSAEGINWDVKKVVQDEFSARQGQGPIRATYEQNVLSPSICQISKQPVKTPFESNRIEPEILSALKSNPYHFSFNSAPSATQHQTMA